MSDTEATSQTTKKEIANVVQHFKQANFFSKEKAFKPWCS